MKKILIKVGDKIEVDMEGFKGKECLKEAERMNELLKMHGIKSDLKDFKPKPELQMQEDVQYESQKEVVD